MKDAEKPVVNPLVVLREEFDDWAILFDPDTGNAFGLNPTGVFVWKLLDGEHAAENLAEKLLGPGDSLPDRAVDHIRAFVDQLVAQGLAGYETGGAGPRPEPGGPLPAGAADGVKPLSYEPPRLVQLGGEEAAHGACSGGSHATQCTTGNVASSCCSSGTSGAGDPCCSGSCPYPCDCGGCASEYGCGMGSGAACGCAHGPWAAGGCGNGQMTA